MLAVLLLGGVASALVGVLRDRDPSGYPQRIGFERPSDPLPARPGVLAATFVDNDFGNARGLGVTASGDLFELPGDTALSPDGAVLLVQSWEWNGRFEVRDLVTGSITRVADLSRRLRIGPGVDWSPDNTLVLIDSTTHPRHDEGPSVVELDTGETTPLAEGTPAGFLSPTEVVTVTVGDALAVTTTDLDTGSSTAQPLVATDGWTGDPVNRPAASLSPDGRLLLLVEPGRDAVARLFSLADGREVWSVDVDNWDGCAPSWRGHDPVLPVRFEPGGGPQGWAGAEQLTADDAISLVAVHPRLQSRCLVLTSGALEAGPRWALFGTSTGLLTWYAGPAVVAAALALGVVALVVRRRRRGSERPVGQA
ncbi:hypothetical protein GCM10009623_37380 [Nocardioides aestuarii]